MKRTSIILICCLLCLFYLSALAQEEKHPMTIEDVLQVKNVFDTQISADGSWILFGVRKPNLKENQFNSDLWMVRTTGGTPIQMTYSPANESNWQWAPNGYSIGFISSRDGKPQIYLMPVNGGEAKKLTDSKTGVQDFQWSPEGRQIAYLALEPLSEKQEQRLKNKQDEKVVGTDFRYSHLWIIDVYSKESRQLTKGKFQVADFDWSPDNKEIAFEHWTTPEIPSLFQANLSIISVLSGTRRTIVYRKGFDRNPKYSPNGEKLAFISQDEDTTWYSNSYICIYDLKDHKIENITKQFDNQIGSYLWSPDGKSLYFQGGDKTNIYIWKISDGGGTPKVLSVMPGVNTGFSVSKDGKLMSFVHQDGSTPPDVYYTSTGNFSPHKITEMHTYLDSFQLSIPEIIHWSGRDGKRIEGILYKPLDYQHGRKVPLLTVVHGGPAGFYTNSFSMGYVYPYQVFAAKGYAVLLPNPRGSGNYGYEFRHANFQDWGGEDYWDIMRGIDHVISMGVADSSKLGIMGWSYGGYMTSWIITQTDRFKAASVGAGVTNLFSFVGQTDIPEFMRSYWGEWPWFNPELYRSRSALYHIKNVSTPTLIQHGEQDVRVPIAQGRELYVGLKKNGVETKFVIYPRQPHGLREPKLLLDAMRRNVEWMDKYILN